MTKQRIYFYIIAGILVLAGGLAYRYSDKMDSLLPVKEEYALKQKQLMKFRGMVQKRSRLESQLVALNRTLERAEAGLLTGETRALAAVDIQNLLNDIANRSQVEIKSMRVLQARPFGSDDIETARYLTVPIQVGIQSNIRQLKDMLYSIETYSKLLRVDTLRMRVPNAKKPEDIHSTLTVAGFMKQRKE